MMWAFWAGGLGLGVGLGFIAGFFTGSWSIRRIGFAIKVRETPVDNPLVPQIPKTGWTLPEDGVGAENPLGPPPPSPAKFVKRDPRDWLDDLPSRKANR
jgi:hypothetical protein